MRYEERGSAKFYYFYDASGKISLVQYYSPSKTVGYYTLTNSRGDVIALYDGSGKCVVEYEYDAWGNCTIVSDSTGFNFGKLNPIRYRGYYYDSETGLYYLQSRYYNPQVGRFLNADLQISGVGGYVLGYNVFAYCFNNPVNSSDPTGHWPNWSNLLKGSAWIAVGITAVCVGVSVLTCGVAAPAMMAVATVTVGAGVLTAVNGVAEIGEAFTGYNIVRDTVFSGNQKAYDSYANTTAAVAEVGTAICGGWLKSKTPTGTSRGSTGRTEPTNLREQLAMEQVKSNPLEGAKVINNNLNDSRWMGWSKMARNVNGVEIHYNYNEFLQLFDDFKFID